jgi:hypothetical protein
MNSIIHKGKKQGEFLGVTNYTYLHELGKREKGGGAAFWVFGVVRCWNGCSTITVAIRMLQRIILTGAPRAKALSPE